MADQLKLLAQLWRRPAAAMGAILDRGSALFALVAALATSFLLQTGLRVPGGFLAPVFVLGAVYVPGLLGLSALVARAGSFQRDYSPLLTCAAMAWAAVTLPLAVAAWFVPPVVAAGAAILAALYFALLMFFAVRTLFGAGNGASAVVVALSWIPLAAVVFFWGPLSYRLGWLASPFFLLYAWYFLGGELGELGAGLRRRQSFRRMLDAAALNPHDGDAQYQLGLIHQQRRQFSDAVRRFQMAVAIDPEATDAHYQLGRIARQQGRIDDALAHFEAVLRQDEKHSAGEIHRELGATYLEAGRYEDARRELAAYEDRRPHDPEGLCRYAETLERLGDPAGARELYLRAVEAARTAPRYLRRTNARWSRLAQREARRLGHE